MSLPDCLNRQDALLTINTNMQPPLNEAIPGLSINPLFLDGENGLWVLRVKFAPGTTLPMHFHTGTVHFYTLAGCWHYLEYPEQKQTAGSYLYEPRCSIHTFHCPEDGGGADGFMVVAGANINFDDGGNFLNIMDAAWIEKTLHDASAAQGIKPPRYIKPMRGAGYSND